jgi:hypothetical protein
MSDILTQSDNALISQVFETLQRLLALRPAAAHTPGLRALQVSGGDPALVESASLCAAGDSRAIGADDRNLVSGVDLLALAGRARGALAALAAAALLGEEGGDPGVVDEVADTAEGGEEEEVEEDAVKTTNVSFIPQCVLIWTKYPYICGSNQDKGASTMLTVSL